MQAFWGVAQFLASIYAADFISGLVHFHLDYQTIHDKELRLHEEPTIPDIVTFKTQDAFQRASRGDQFLWNFHVHHDVPFPSADSTTELFWQIARPLAPLVLAIVASMYYQWIDVWVGRMLLVACALGSITQFTHFAAHARSRGLVTNRVVVFLQDARIILHPDTHRIHHEKYDCAFCILNGWANPAVDLLRCLGSHVGLFPKEAPTITVRRERAKAHLGKKGELTPEGGSTQSSATLARRTRGET